MTEPIRGILRAAILTQGSGAGGNINCAIRPPESEVWDIIQCRGSHDDAGGLTVQWWLNDVVGPIQLILFSGTGTRYLHPDIGYPARPLRLTHASYLNFYVAGMAGAKTITVHVAYERILGLPLWNNL